MATGEIYKFERKTHICRKKLNIQKMVFNMATGENYIFDGKCYILKNISISKYFLIEIFFNLVDPVYGGALSIDRSYVPRA